MNVWLALRSLLWTIVLPGFFAGYVPWRYFGLGEVQLELSRPTHVLGLACVAAGSALLGACVFEFASSGRGTLSPLDPPRRLVVRGLYRYVRNPMYVSVTTIVLGEVLISRSAALAVYWTIWFACVNLFVLGYEEPTLRRQFGASYDEYTRQVGRWIPRWRYPFWARRVLPFAAVLDEGADMEAAVREIAALARDGSRGSVTVLATTEAQAAADVAGAIAAEARRELYRVDLAALVSKHVGETEKALDRIFAEVRRSGAILLFDEADALFGSRAEADRADAETNSRLKRYLLERSKASASFVLIVLRQAESATDVSFADYVLSCVAPTQRRSTRAVE